MRARRFLHGRLWQPLWLLPLVLLVFVLGVAAVLDRQQVREAAATQREASRDAERQASALADELGNVVSARLATLRTARLGLADADDPDDEMDALAERVEGLAREFPGLASVSVIHADGRLWRGAGAAMGAPGVRPDEDPVVRGPFRRALASREPAASEIIDLPIGRRIIIFAPIEGGDAPSDLVLAGEFDTGTLVRAALNELDPDRMRSMVYSIRGPGGERITAVPAPQGWPSITRRVRIVDTEWTLRVAYPPPDPAGMYAARVAIWAIGLVVGLGLALGLYLLRRQMSALAAALDRQREESLRRKAAEREARQLAGQLRSAQQAAQRLSNSVESDAIVELFLGSVAERMDAEVATLYLFDEDGDEVVGRKRIVCRDPIEEISSIREQDIQQVRAPVALLPGIAHAVATGEPDLFDASAGGADPGWRLPGSVRTAEIVLSVPLLVGGHIIGVATWEIFERRRDFERGTVTYAQALAVTAAAALHTAELFDSLEQARRQAQEEASRFGTILDQMADGVVVVDQSGRVERTNQAALGLLGDQLIDLEIGDWPETLGLRMPDGLPLKPEDFPLQRALRGERVRRSEFARPGTWGDDRVYSGSAAPIHGQGEGAALSGAALVFRDITDEKQYAEMLRHTIRQQREQAEALESVNTDLREATRAKDQFLAVMSHELRTPINAIIGYGELLTMEVKGTLNDQQKQMLERVSGSSKHLLQLINQVLDLAKMGAGQTEVTIVPVPLREVVRRCVEQVEPAAHRKRLRLVTDVPDEEMEHPVVALADETRLSQVLLNLLSNAVKFTDSGEVRVRYRRVGSRVKISVHDTGPGIPRDQQSMIFEEFYQADGHLARSAGGTGLGLPITRRLVELMDGTVSVRSVSGKGSVFVVNLPADGSPEPSAAGRGADILMLTENSGLCLRPTGGGRRARATRDPGELHRWIRDSPEAEVVLDLATPQLAAWRVLASLIASATKDVSVRLMAGRQDGETCDLGAVQVLGKPVSLERVLHLSRPHMSRSEDCSAVLLSQDTHMRGIVGEALAAAGCSVRAAVNGREAADALGQAHPHLLFVDLASSADDSFRLLLTVSGGRYSDVARTVAFVPQAPTTEEMETMQRAADRVLLAQSSGIGGVAPDPPVSSGPPTHRYGTAHE